MSAPLVLDGSLGEGGGQVLRTALGLSLVTGRAFRIERIRARRSRPGLLRQHLTAVHAAARVGRAEARGATLGSSQLEFVPGNVVPGDHAFDVGTAGSATLVLQAVLPALCCAPAPSRLVLEGGTHNPSAPPFDFLARVFLPLVARMGPRFEARLERPGFYPAGGGRFTVDILPAPRLERLDLLERGRVLAQRARALVANLPRHVGVRELAHVAETFGWRADQLAIESADHAHGPGNALLLELECENVTEIVTGFGERGVRAEAVAEAAVREAQRYLDAEVPVGEHLADQILIPMALAGGGSFATLPLTPHAATNIEIIRCFLDAGVTVTPRDARSVTVEVRS